MRKTLAAGSVAGAAFWLYRATLLPGFDFGDTGSLQTTVTAAHLTPRNGYPLYFAIGRLFVWLTAEDPAWAMNLASAVTGALACGTIVLVATELSGSLLAGMGAALLVAGSYTFWSQAIIAEVYALHVGLIALTMLLALRWQSAPSSARLVAFFAAYALAFGNHLSMILLAPGYALFVLLSARRHDGGIWTVLAPRIIAIALLVAALGASQYAWNLAGLWHTSPPASVIDAAAQFWFDVTKSDWRETLVLSVPRSMLADHLAMYAFDLRQQFGLAIPVLALVGLVGLFSTDVRRALLLLASYIVTVVFALGYNVGDTHVFFLPSHLCVALAAAAGISEAGRRLRWKQTATVASFGLVLYAAVRMYADFPALDRSRDDRPQAVMSALTEGLDDRHSVLIADLNWQVQNGLSYYGRHVRPGVAYTRAADVLLYAPVLVRDNAAIGRRIVATDRSRRQLEDAYQPLLSIMPDDRVRVPTIAAAAVNLAPGAPYALCVLKPAREFTIDHEDLAAALDALTGRALRSMPEGDYAVVVGRAGQPPQLSVGSASPFRRSTVVADVPVEIRMESWLAADTIRRMGFGHVIARRRHTLIVERGVSLVAFDDRGVPTRTVYAASLFGAQRRYFVALSRDIVDP